MSIFSVIAQMSIALKSIAQMSILLKGPRPMLTAAVMKGNSRVQGSAMRKTKRTATYVDSRSHERKQPCTRIRDAQNIKDRDLC